MIKLITPQWRQPPGVMAYSTTRHGGVSQPPYHTLNLGNHCGDNPAHVAENRQRLAHAAQLPAEPVWLEQVHGCQVLRFGDTPPAHRRADACHTDKPGVVCAVMTADCLPVLFCDHAGSEVAAAHAGWRGLCAGVLEQTVASFRQPACQLMAWLGPAISAQAFEVGEEVRAAFMAHDRRAASAFRPCPPNPYQPNTRQSNTHQSDTRQPQKYLADLYLLARQRLYAAGVRQIDGGDRCTYLEPDDFFSWRREGGNTGRMASLIWLAA